MLVLQSSFQLAHVGKRTNFGRFGAGIYTSATSSKVGSFSYKEINIKTVVYSIGQRLLLGECVFE